MRAGGVPCFCVFDFRDLFTFTQSECLAKFRPKVHQVSRAELGNSPRQFSWRGGAGDRAALVRWSGFDPATGEPWADSWEPRAALTSDLRGGGLIRRRRTAAEIREEERRVREDWDERHNHTRKSRRLQGEASEEENSLHVPIEVERDQSVGELYVRLPSSVLCAGTFGGRCLGVGRRAVSAVITVTVTVTKTTVRSLDRY